MSFTPDPSALPPGRALASDASGALFARSSDGGLAGSNPLDLAGSAVASAPCLAAGNEGEDDGDGTFTVARRR